eukprot:7557773-Heterocapsa_arctica.AAC.1
MVIARALPDSLLPTKTHKNDVDRQMANVIYPIYFPDVFPLLVFPIDLVYPMSVISRGRERVDLLHDGDDAVALAQVPDVLLAITVVIDRS